MFVGQYVNTRKSRVARQLFRGRSTPSLTLTPSSQPVHPRGIDSNVPPSHIAHPTPTSQPVARTPITPDAPTVCNVHMAKLGIRLTSIAVLVWSLQACC